MSIDIISTAPWPVCDLSNFAGHRFTFDGVQCASMEGLLQAFKFGDVWMQTRLCGLEGIVAKVAGRAGNGWKTNQNLHWKIYDFPRDSQDYQLLLNQAYSALYRDSRAFREALKATGNGMFTHSIGGDDPAQTILTAKEFCSRLEFLRANPPLYL